MMENVRFTRNRLLLILFLALLFQNCKKSDSLGAATGDMMMELGKKPMDVDLQLVADNLVSPLSVIPFPDNSNRLAVLEQIGKILIIDASGNLLNTPFLDVTSLMVPLNPGFDERGLIGLAFHPDYSTNGKFYVYYNAPPNPGAPPGGTAWNNLSVIAEFMVSGSDPNMADLTTERRLLELDDPQGNHNGGAMEFGPDGYLYIAIGDGGGANDVAPGHVEDWYPANAGGNAQNIEANLFGKILRINVDAGNPYAVPADNPFVGKTGLDEIWAYGLRNPYRISFDMGGNRDLIAGDAGQLLYEEINLIKKGGNYGWNVKEGRACFNAASNLTTFPNCPNKDIYGNKLLEPNVIVNHFMNPAGGRATTIIGGNVYRGSAIPSLYGKYIFGSFSQTPGTLNGEVFAAHMAGNGQWPYKELELKSFPGHIGHFIKGFGQDLEGEVYITVTDIVGPTGNTGKIYKIVPAN